jgi:hypothetical protein
VVVEMALMRIVIGAAYTAVVARFYPDFIGLSQLERAALLSPPLMAQRGLGMALVGIALAFLVEH